MPDIREGSGIFALNGEGGQTVELRKSSQPQMNTDKYGYLSAACIRQPTKRVNGFGASMT
jgi:hypothetical protein